jgi:hypothetical protein
MTVQYIDVGDEQREAEPGLRRYRDDFVRVWGAFAITLGRTGDKVGTVPAVFGATYPDRRPAQDTPIFCSIVSTRSSSAAGCVLAQSCQLV